MTIDLNKTVQTFEQILLTEQSSPITNRGDIGASKLRRKELCTLLGEIGAVGNALSSAIYNLPEHPNEQIMDWAEAVLAMPNLALVVLDTTGVQEDSDIIRILARSPQENGGLHLDQIIRPQRQSTPNTAYTGITERELESAPTLAEAWEFISRELRGCYFVSFNLDFVKSRLADNIQHYGLSRLPFLSDCLMRKAKSYFGIEGYGSGLKLPEACLRIGRQLPTSPPLAYDRAAGQLALLSAMANGMTSVAAPDASTDLSELDDHPF
jgi:hypothetical protein